MLALILIFLPLWTKFPEHVCTHCLLLFSSHSFLSVHMKSAFFLTSPLIFLYQKSPITTKLNSSLFCIWCADHTVLETFSLLGSLTPNHSPWAWRTGSSYYSWLQHVSVYHCLMIGVLFSPKSHFQWPTLIKWSWLSDVFSSLVLPLCFMPTPSTIRCCH